MADSASDARESGEQLLQDVRALRHHFEEFLSATRAWSGNSLDVVRERVGDRLRDAREQMTTVGNQAVEKGRYAASATDQYVRGNPWQAVAVAALAGMLIGVMSTSSRR